MGVTVEAEAFFYHSYKKLGRLKKSLVNEQESVPQMKAIRLQFFTRKVTGMGAVITVVPFNLKVILNNCQLSACKNLHFSNVYILEQMDEINWIFNYVVFYLWKSITLSVSKNQLIQEESRAIFYWHSDLLSLKGVILIYFL